MKSLFSNLKPNLLITYILQAFLAGVLLQTAFSVEYFGWHRYLSIIGFFALFWWSWLLWKRQERAFLIGLSFGFGWCGIEAWWLIETLHIYGALPYIAAIAVVAFLGLVLALFPASAAWLAAKTAGKRPDMIWFTLPICMALAEWLRGHVFTGLPWTPIGSLLLEFDMIKGYLAVFGVYGSTALVMFFFLLIHISLGSNKLYEKENIVLFIFMIIVFSGSAFIPSDYDTHNYRAALIQGNISQDQKWDAAFLEEIMQRYTRLSAEAANKDVDIIIWPEAALPFFPSDAPQWSDWLNKRMLEWDKPVLFGGLKAGYDGDTLYGLNGLYLFQPDAYASNELDFAGKKHLVPFGEYVPEWLPFVRKIVPFTMDFRPDSGDSILTVGNLRFGSLICYEAIFPEEARARVLAGANVLVHVSNDAWYGKTPAAYQHLQAARVRAVETNRYVLRVANTGITAIIAPDGSVQDQIDWFKDGTLIGEFHTSTNQTLYMRWGDWPLLLMLLLLIAIGWRNHNYVVQEEKSV
ncbi:MAG: apolipoprotein N-acyltransferase [Mariprofundales bacterium]